MRLYLMPVRLLVVALGSGLGAACAHEVEPWEAPSSRDVDATSSMPPASDAGGARPDVDAGSDGGARPCRVSFSKEVVPALAKSGCTSVTCHGTRFREPRLEEKELEITYKALIAYKIGDRAYVKPMSADLKDSAMSCHLHGTCGVKMPPNGEELPKDLIAAVDTWLSCGAPNN